MTRLEKAQAALDAAREQDVGSVVWQDLLNVAKVQAEIVQAEALERIAKALTKGQVAVVVAR